MNLTPESERNYQYKTNYMAKFLSKKSNEIINKINNKNK